MVVTCPACGGASRDREFCDHCNADLMPAAAALPPAVCPLAPDNPLLLTPEQVQALSRPEASVTVAAGEPCWRLHWIAAAHWPARQPFVEERQRCPAAV